MFRSNCVGLRYRWLARSKQATFRAIHEGKQVVAEDGQIEGDAIIP